ncbi:hypothetical protein GGD54_000140 [Rhizobium tropici]|uniref:Uncharacterized protein n=1 Tax=Rhizobium tropici TaxID=398 RepID=A0ABR6QT52_RHITR|nr:hypothetical protein [Rhizobium tropici]MBB5590703.1 hypothetical protein [Rhizobium tropici]MBB6490088.1 hypothetical protein [Rhizobium tropici]
MDSTSTAMPFSLAIEDILVHAYIHRFIRSFVVHA